jgi:hypothetical protein
VRVVEVEHGRFIPTAIFPIIVTKDNVVMRPGNRKVGLVVRHLLGKFVFGKVKVRGVWNRILVAPPEEEFDEFVTSISVRSPSSSRTIPEFEHNDFMAVTPNSCLLFSRQQDYHIIASFFNQLYDHQQVSNQLFQQIYLYSTSPLTPLVPGKLKDFHLNFINEVLSNTLVDVAPIENPIVFMACSRDVSQNCIYLEDTVTMEGFAAPFFANHRQNAPMLLKLACGVHELEVTHLWSGYGKNREEGEVGE